MLNAIKANAAEMNKKVCPYAVKNNGIFGTPEKICAYPKFCSNEFRGKCLSESIIPPKFAADEDKSASKR